MGGETERDRQLGWARTRILALVGPSVTAVTMIQNGKGSLFTPPCPNNSKGGKKQLGRMGEISTLLKEKGNKKGR